MLQVMMVAANLIFFTDFLLLLFREESFKCGWGRKNKYNNIIYLAWALQFESFNLKIIKANIRTVGSFYRKCEKKFQ